MRIFTELQKLFARLGVRGTGLVILTGCALYGVTASGQPAPPKPGATASGKPAPTASSRPKPAPKASTPAASPSAGAPAPPAPPSSGPAQLSPAAAPSVTISVFSGRPDPVFRIKDAKELDELRARLKSAPPSTKAVQGSVIRPVLGYRGVIVENRGALAGVPPRFAVHDGVIEVRGERTTYLTDKDRALERWLIDLALRTKAIDQQLHAKITARW